MKNILVTGGNTGIGFALCRKLVAEHNCRVYLGARNAERGKRAVDEIRAQHLDAIEFLLIDVSDEESVRTAATQLREKGVTLYALVNNAGVGFQTDPGGGDELLATNFYGPKRVSEAFLGSIDPTVGRIINVSSGAASMWLRKQSEETKALFTSDMTTWDELAARVETIKNAGEGFLYGVSKAALNGYTIQQSKAYPNLLCTSLSPGFIQTNMTAGFGAKLSPEQGTVSYLKCLFGDVHSGCYYGSDGLRSPLTVTRDPGTPEYEGEDNPDPKKYNK